MGLKNTVPGLENRIKDLEQVLNLIFKTWYKKNIEGKTRKKLIFLFQNLLKTVENVCCRSVNNLKTSCSVFH